MKRKAAIILCLVLCAMTFFGCSSSELGYLNMSRELSNMTEYEFSGDMEIYYDAEGMKDFMINEIGSVYYTKEELEEQYAAFSGKKKISFFYDGSVDMSEENVEIYLDMAVSIDGKRTPLGDMYISMTDGIYVERDMLKNIYKISEDILEGYEDSYLYSEAFEKDLIQALGTSEYIEIISAEDISAQMKSGAITPDMFTSQIENNKSIYDAAVKFISDTFSGYSTGFVSSVAGGYQISVTGDKLIDMLSQILEYMSKNVDTVVDSFVVYMSSIYEVMENAYGEEYIGENPYNTEIAQKEKLQIAGMLSGIKGQLDYLNTSGKLDAIKAFSYDETTKKSGNSYTGESLLSMDYNSKNLAYLKCSSSVTPKSTEIQFPTEGSDVASVSKNIEALEQKYNPVHIAEITWEKTTTYYGEQYCDVYSEKAYSSPIGSKETFNWYEYKNVNKSMYLPLRDICDLFGEEVGWDNKAKQAYVIKDGKQIPMDGILDTKTTYVKIKDFEELGYKVTYNGSDEYYHTATIERN